MTICLCSIYIILTFLNFISYNNGERNKKLVIISLLFVSILMCGTYGIYDGSSYDLSNYRAQYEVYNPLEDDNFWNYYIFNICMRIGQICHLTFTQWWALMTIGSLYLICNVIKRFNLNIHLFLLVFMLYYLFNFYTGLKAYYGFCFFLLAFGFLTRDGVKNKLLYILFILIAGGFHMMYYMFLIFTVIDNNHQFYTSNKFIRIICIISIFASILLRLSGSATRVLQQVFSFMENEKIDAYTALSTNLSFYFLVGMQLLTLYYIWSYSRLHSNDKSVQVNQQVLLIAGYLTVLFYPLFMLSMTFGRLTTTFSFLAIIYSGKNSYCYKVALRRRILMPAAFILMGYYFQQFVIGNMFNNSILPLLNLRIFHL